MPDGFVQIREGESRPVFAQETVTTGTLSIETLPAPTVTLFDANGAIVAGFDTVPATGYDTAALTAPRVWFTLDTSVLEVGYYTLVFTFSAIGSDGTERIYEPTLEIQVLNMRA